MTQLEKSLSSLITEKAKSAGASLAGIASAFEMQASPSHKDFGPIRWPSKGASLLVIALEHNEKEPDLDWWGVASGTAGNKRLKDISREVKQYLDDEFDEKAWLLPYEPGVFLKDAAVFAGIGIIGDNNLLITQEYGPRIRLRAVLIERELSPTGRLAYSPCDDCDHACWQACVQDAFTSGSYSSGRCKRQMEIDEKNRAAVKIDKNDTSLTPIVKYCRACEFSCPMGKRNYSG